MPQALNKFGIRDFATKENYLCSHLKQKCYFHFLAKYLRVFTSTRNFIKFRPKVSKHKPINLNIFKFPNAIACGIVHCARKSYNIDIIRSLSFLFGIFSSMQGIPLSGHPELTSHLKWLDLRLSSSGGLI